MQPTAPRERIEGLDVLRGFALIGVLIINVGLASLVTPETAAELPTFSFDRITTEVIRVVVTRCASSASTRATSGSSPSAGTPA